MSNSLNINDAYKKAVEYANILISGGVLNNTDDDDDILKDIDNNLKNTLNDIANEKETIVDKNNNIVGIDSIDLLFEENIKNFDALNKYNSEFNQNQKSEINKKIDELKTLLTSIQSKIINLELKSSITIIVDKYISEIKQNENMSSSISDDNNKNIDEKYNNFVSLIDNIQNIITKITEQNDSITDILSDAKKNQDENTKKILDHITNIIVQQNSRNTITDLKIDNFNTRIGNLIIHLFQKQMSEIHDIKGMIGQPKDNKENEELNTQIDSLKQLILDFNKQKENDIQQFKELLIEDKQKYVDSQTDMIKLAQDVVSKKWDIEDIILGNNTNINETLQNILSNETNLTNGINNLIGQINTSISNIQNNIINEITNSNTVISQSITTLNEDLTTKMQESNIAIKNLIDETNKKLDSISLKIDKLIVSVTQIDTNVQAVVTNVSTIQKEIQKVQTSLPKAVSTALASQFQILNTNLQNMTTKLDTVEEKLKNIVTIVYFKVENSTPNMLYYVDMIKSEYDNLQFGASSIKMPFSQITNTRDLKDKISDLLTKQSVPLKTNFIFSYNKQTNAYEDIIMF